MTPIVRDVTLRVLCDTVDLLLLLSDEIEMRRLYVAHAEGALRMAAGIVELQRELLEGKCYERPGRKAAPSAGS